MTAIAACGSVASMPPLDNGKAALRVHFGLASYPFGRLDDLSQAMTVASHQALLRSVAFAVRHGVRGARVIGQPGCGKTVISRLLADKLGADCCVAWISGVSSSAATLLRDICEAFRVVLPCDEPPEAALARHVRTRQAWGERCVLVIDDADCLGQEGGRILQALLEHEGQMPQLVLFGDDALDSLLQSPRLKPLAQELAFSYAIDPLSEDDIRLYLHHRLRSARQERGRRAFHDSAICMAAGQAEGVLATANLIADRAMTTAFAAGAGAVGVTHVERAVAELRGLVPPVPFMSRAVVRRLMAFTVVGVTALAGFAWQMRPVEQTSLWGAESGRTWSAHALAPHRVPCR